MTARDHFSAGMGGFYCSTTAPSQLGLLSFKHGIKKFDELLLTDASTLTPHLATVLVRLTISDCGAPCYRSLPRSHLDGSQIDLELGSSKETPTSPERSR